MNTYAAYANATPARPSVRSTEEMSPARGDRIGDRPGPVRRQQFDPARARAKPEPPRGEPPDPVLAGGFGTEQIDPASGCRLRIRHRELHPVDPAEHEPLPYYWTGRSKAAEIRPFRQNGRGKTQGKLPRNSP